MEDVQKWLIVPDKFKGTLSSKEVCIAISSGIENAGHPIRIKSIPIADGGDGSLDILMSYMSLDEISVKTMDPLGREIWVKYGRKKNKAFIESALTVGLSLLSPSEYDPLYASTYGLGVIIKDAIEKGCDEINIFLGGSATNEAGIGMLMAIGFEFQDANGHILSNLPKDAMEIQKIQLKNFIDLKAIKFKVYADVINPIVGHNGATYSFARQKGATEIMLPILEERNLYLLRQLEKLSQSKNLASLAYGGAAGGLGLAFSVFLNAELRSGLQFFIKTLGIEKLIEESDAVISGEGKLDQDSFGGKVVSGISDCCKKHRKPLYLIVGQNALGTTNSENLYGKVISISSSEDDIDYSIQNAESLLKSAGEKLAGTIFSEP